MYLRRVISLAKWDILAVCNKSGECELLTFLGELNRKYHGSRDNLMALLKRVSKDQQKQLQLPTDICHYADKKEKIWQFVAGDIRLLWFYSGNGKVIICSHAFMKKSQKTPKKEISKALTVKCDYESVKDSEDIKIIPTTGG